MKQIKTKNNNKSNSLILYKEYNSFKNTCSNLADVGCKLLRLGIRFGKEYYNYGSSKQFNYPKFLERIISFRLSELKCETLKINLSSTMLKLDAIS